MSIVALIDLLLLLAMPIASYILIKRAGDHRPPVIVMISFPVVILLSFILLAFYAALWNPVDLNPFFQILAGGFLCGVTFLSHTGSRRLRSTALSLLVALFVITVYVLPMGLHRTGNPSYVDSINNVRFQSTGRVLHKCRTMKQHGLSSAEVDFLRAECDAQYGTITLYIPIERWYSRIIGVWETMPVDFQILSEPRDDKTAYVLKPVAPPLDALDAIDQYTWTYCWIEPKPD